jgi:hypothetical protein
MECDNCGIEDELIYKFAGTEACEDCWREYFVDNELYEDQSWNDFKNNSLKLIKGSIK